MAIKNRFFNIEERRLYGSVLRSIVDSFAKKRQKTIEIKEYDTITLRKTPRIKNNRGKHIKSIIDKNRIIKLPQNIYINGKYYADNYKYRFYLKSKTPHIRIKNGEKEHIREHYVTHFPYQKHIKIIIQTGIRLINNNYYQLIPPPFTNFSIHIYDTKKDLTFNYTIKKNHNLPISRQK